MVCEDEALIATDLWDIVEDGYTEASLGTTLLEAQEKKLRKDKQWNANEAKNFKL